MVRSCRTWALALACTLVVAGGASAQTTTYTSTETIPVPPASSYAGAGGGDGWDLSLSSGQVFNVFHHQGALNVACHEQRDASLCYPVRTITDGGGTGFRSSSHSGTALDPATGHLLVYATRTDDTAGVVCVDTAAAATSTNPFCGFTALTAVGDGGTTSVPMKVGRRLYAFNYVNGAVTGDRDKLLCFDLDANGPCAGQPYAVDVGAGAVAVGGFPVPATAAIGDQLVIPIITGGTPRLACFDDSLRAECAGSWPADPGAGYVDGDNGSPFPRLDGTGAVTGFCLPTDANPCFDLAGASAPTPAGMTAALGSNTGWGGPAVTIGARVYLADGDDNQIRCYNAATAASCDGFPRATPGASYLYTVNRDPQRPTCLWINADTGTAQIQNMDAFTGGACGSGATRVLSDQLVASGSQCEPAAYRRMEVLKPAPGGYASGTIGFADQNGDGVGIADRALDGAGAVDLTGIGLEAVRKPQFLISLAGTPADPTEVVVRLTWEGTYDPACLGDGIQAGAPASQPASAPPAATPPVVQVQGTVSASCSGRRRFRVVLRHQRRVRYVSARFTLDGKPLATRRFKGKLGTVVDLRKQGRRTAVLRIRARTASGAVLTGKRSYHPCTKRRAKRPPTL